MKWWITQKDHISSTLEAICIIDEAIEGEEDNLQFNNTQDVTHFAEGPGGQTMDFVVKTYEKKPKIPVRVFFSFLVDTVKKIAIGDNMACTT